MIIHPPFFAYRSILRGLVDREYGFCLTCAKGDVNRVRKELKRRPSLANAAVRLRWWDCISLTYGVAGLPVQEMFRGAYGLTCLHIAAACGHYEIVQSLIDSGANVNATGRKGQSPLHTSIFSGSKQMVQLLIDNGADISLRNKEGNTPLDLAEKYERKLNNKMDKRPYTEICEIIGRQKS